MESFFKADGPLVNFLTKFGQLVMLTAVWIICCIPIITTGPAMSAFYYAVMKSVRRDVGYPVREFFRSFRRTLKDGIIFTVIYLAGAALIYVNVQYMANVPGKSHLFMLFAYIVLAAVSIGIACYLFPALSRFNVSRGRLIRMALYMALTRFPLTAVLVAAPAGLAWLCMYHLPVACLLFVPGIWCYISTFLVEPALKKFIPEPDEGEKEWYDE